MSIVPDAAAVEKGRRFSLSIVWCHVHAGSSWRLCAVTKYQCHGEVYSTVSDTFSSGQP